MPTYLVKAKRTYHTSMDDASYDLEVWARTPEEARREVWLPSYDEIISVEVHPTLHLPDPSETLAGTLARWATAFQVIAILLLVTIVVAMLTAGVVLVADNRLILDPMALLGLIAAAMACFLSRLLLLFMAQHLRNTDPDREEQTTPQAAKTPAG